MKIDEFNSKYQIYDTNDGDDIIVIDLKYLNTKNPTFEIVEIDKLDFWRWVVRNERNVVREWPAATDPTANVVDHCIPYDDYITLPQYQVAMTEYLSINSHLLNE